MLIQALLFGEREVSAPIVEIKTDNRTQREIVADIAREYKVSASEMFFIIEHEGGWNQESCVRSEYINKKGKRENSWGWYQINLDAHPDVSKEKACDLIQSSEWTARQLKEGKIGIWTSIRNPN